MPTHATLTAGVIPIAQLATGTPDGTKFIRDDGTLVTPSTGGVSDGDKGDIVVSASGATWSLDSGVVTAAGRAILDDATAGDQRTTLGLGSAATTSSSDYATAGHNHTGVYQPLATPLTDTTAAFTTAQETKLSGIAAGAEVNVNADWSSGAGDSQILNKPTLGGAAALNVGTTAGTVAAGDHTHVAANISDFSTAADARIAAAVVNALSDVTITTPADGQVLKYSGGIWVNGTDATGAGGGNTLYAPGSVTIATGNFQLHVNRLQLTTTQRLAIAGTGRFRNI